MALVLPQFDGPHIIPRIVLGNKTLCLIWWEDSVKSILLTLRDMGCLINFIMPITTMNGQSKYLYHLYLTQKYIGYKKKKEKKRVLTY